MCKEKLFKLYKFLRLPILLVLGFGVILLKTHLAFGGDYLSFQNLRISGIIFIVSVIIICTGILIDLISDLVNFYKNKNTADS